MDAAQETFEGGVDDKDGRREVCCGNLRSMKLGEEEKKDSQMERFKLTEALAMWGPQAVGASS